MEIIIGGERDREFYVREREMRVRKRVYSYNYNDTYSDKVHIVLVVVEIIWKREKGDYTNCYKYNDK